MSDNSSNNQRIAKNTFFLYIRMFLVLGITLYTSRVILKVLGVEDFGIYNVVAGFVMMFGFLNSTLSTSMQRFYNYELGKNGECGISRVYTTGFWIHVVIAIVFLFLLESGGLWYINNIMVIPPDRLFASNFVFQSVVLSMVLVLLQIPYIGSILAYERMDFYAIMSIIDVVLKLIIVIVLPYLNQDKLIAYAVLLSMISVFNFVCYFVYAKNTSRGLRLEKRIDRTILNEMLSFSGWNLVGTFAYMFKGQGLNMVLNVFFGPIVNAARGISFQVNSAVTGFSNNIVTAFRPQLVNSYAKEDKHRVLQLFYTESKVCFGLMLLLSIPLILETNFILHKWLGDTIPTDADIFTRLVLLDLLICVFNQPVVQVAFATGKIRRFQIANSIVNLSILPTSFILLKIGLPATSVFIATIVFSILNQTVCVYEVDRIYSIGIKDYLCNVVSPCVLVFALSFTMPFVFYHILVEGLYRFLIVGCADVVFTIPLIYFILFSKEEKAFVSILILSKLKKN